MTALTIIYKYFNKKMNSRVEEPDDVDDATQQQRQRQKKDIDPLVAIVMNEDIIKISSTLIAKLEHVRYDRDNTRQSVLVTPWARDLFKATSRRLNPKLLADFDIDEWYNQIIRANGVGADYTISPSLVNQGVSTNWLLPLFDMEMKAPGFMMTLHNIMELEGQTKEKLAKFAKEETEYSGWLQSAPLTGPKCLEGPKAPATYGGVRLIGAKH